jgi:hypothetical protein
MLLTSLAISSTFWPAREASVATTADILFLDPFSRHWIFLGGEYHGGSWNVKAKM